MTRRSIPQSALPPVRVRPGSRRLLRSTTLACLLAAACHGQPSVVATNQATSVQLDAIAHRTSDTAGGEPPRVLPTPTPGQVMDGNPQPPKHQ